MLNLRIESAHSAVSRTHRRASDFLHLKGVAAPLRADVQLAVSELASNVVDHAAGRAIELELRLLGDAVFLTVSNQKSPGPADVLPTEVGTDPLADRGRGLVIVHTLVDGMWIHGQIDSTSVTCLLKRDRPVD